MSAAVRLVAIAGLVSALLTGPAAGQAVAPPPGDTAGIRLAPVRRLVAQGRWQDALAALGVPRDSADRALAVRLAINAGVSALRAGDSTTARADWERAAADPDAPVDAFADLAAILLAGGRPDTARAVAIRGLERAPDDTRLLGLRAATVRDTADLRMVLATLRTTHRRRPADVRVALDLAELSAGTDRPAAAALFDTLLESPHPALAVYLGATAFSLGGAQFTSAAATADSGLNRYPRSGELWLLLGRAEAGRRAWRAAETADRHASETLAEPAPAQLALLDAAVAGGDSALAAEQILAMAGARTPRDPLLAAARRGAGWGMRLAADSAYAAILTRYPDDASALDGAGALALAAGDTARSLRFYRRGLALDSSGPSAPLQVLRLSHLGADSGRALLLLAEWRGIAALERAGVAAEPGPGADERAALDSTLRVVLDTVVFRTPWGPGELAQLLIAHPRQPLLERYAAELAARGGDDSVALARYDDLLRQRPSDAAVQRDRAAVLERDGRRDAARDGYARALDLAPADTLVFRALVRLDEPDGRLAELLAQVRRLRIRMPDARVLGEHEVELLQRLGRLAEAQAAARALEAHS